MMEDVEEWRSVVGHEGNYEVSSLGRVRSLDRIVHSSDGRSWGLPGQMLNGIPAWQYPNGKWHYAETALTNVIRARVHLLVLEAFHGPRPAGLIARHLNGNGSDNRASNLKWGSHAENMWDRTEHGRCPAAARNTCPRDHVLAMPNLRQCIPTRACLACARATTAANTAKRAGRPFDKGAYADAAYVRIMETAS